MPLPLPNLDDRRWRDLVDEATALIPRLAPDWTDYNVSDPGITLIDLLAWITEADIFGLDRVPASHRERFVALAAVSIGDTSSEVMAIIDAPRPPASFRLLAGTRSSGW